MQDSSSMKFSYLDLFSDIHSKLGLKQNSMKFTQIFLLEFQALYSVIILKGQSSAKFSTSIILNNRKFVMNMLCSKQIQFAVLPVASSYKYCADLILKTQNQLKFLNASSRSFKRSINFASIIFNRLILCVNLTNYILFLF
jgi:hypothetical protein